MEKSCKNYATQNEQYTAPFCPSNLSVGLVVDSYKKMCEILGEESKTGNAKKSQMKEWECYFSYKKDKYKFIITEIYDIPKSRGDRRAEQSVYIKLIELILMYELSQKNNNTCAYSKSLLFYLLGMVNRNYLSHNRKNALQNIKDYNIHNWQIEHFNSRSNDKLTRILEQALNSMKRRRLIDWDKRWMVVEELNDDGKIKYRDRIIATIEEENYIRYVEKELLNNLGISEIPFKSDKREEYYKKLNIKFKELKGWEKVYKVYEIHYYRPHIIGDIPKVEKEIRKIANDNKTELNKLILKCINQQANTKYYNNLSSVEKAKDKILMDYNDNWIEEKPSIEMIIENAKDKVKEHGEKYIYFEMPEDYIENQLVLANIFINIDEREKNKKTENEAAVDWE